MKKRFTILIAAAVMLLAIMLQPTRLWGQTRSTAAYKTLSFPDDNNANNHVGSYTETWTATSGSDSWSISNFNNNNWNNNWTYIKCGNKNSTSTGIITTSFAIDKPVKTVTINIGAITTSKVNSITLYTSSNNSTWTSAGTFTKSTGEQTVTISSPIANLYYKIEANCAKGSNNGLLQINWVKYNVETFTVTYNNNGGSGTMTDSNSPYFNGSTVTTLANSFTAPTGFSFNGWNTASGGDGTSYDEGDEFTINANTTLYAQWLSAGNYITVSPTSVTPTCAAQNVVFNVDTDQSLTASSVQFYTAASGGTETSKPDWIGTIAYDGSSSPKTLTVPVTENTGVARHAYFTLKNGSIESSRVTINQAAITVATPEFDEDEGTYFEDLLVDITCDTDGATIYYTTDGSTPAANNGTEYDGNGVSIEEGETTLKAIAIKNNVSSPVASATYTVMYPLTTMEAIFEASASAGSYYVTFNNWVVTGVNGNQVFVTDGTKGFIIYKSGHGFSVGNIISGTTTNATALTRFKGSAEFTDLTSSTSDLTVTTGGTVTPQVVTIGDLSGVNTGSVITLNGLTYNSTDGVLSDGDHTITPYTSLYTGTFTNGTIYNITGVYQQYGDDEPHNILPRSSADIVEVHDPAITTSPATSLSVPDYIKGTPESGIDTEILTVNGTYLTADVTVALENGASSDFEMSTDLETWGHSITLNQSNGSVTNAEIAVRLKVGESVADYSDRIVLSSTNATTKYVNVTGSVTYAHVTYNGNGDGVSYVPEDDNDYGYEEEVTVLGEGSMIRTGYEFIGWNTESDGTGDNYDENDTFDITEDITLYAQWDAATYNLHTASMTNGSVSFTVGGNAATTAKTGQKVTLVVTPSTNYGLTNLTVTNETTSWTVSVTNNTFTMPASDIIVSATFKPVVTDELTLTTTGISGGAGYGDWSGKTSNSDAVYAGRSAGGNNSIQLRDKNNTNTPGIVTTSTGGKVKKVSVSWNSNTTSGRYITIYGKTSAYSGYSDLYSNNSSTVGESLGTIVYGTNTELTVTGDYSYIGIKANGALYLDQINITWAPPTYTVTYDANDGSGTMTDPDSPYTKGQTVTVLSNSFTAPDGKEFSRWNTAENGSGIYYNPGSTFEMSNSNVTLYAQWIDHCSVKATMDSDETSATCNYMQGEDRYEVDFTSKVKTLGGCDITEYGFVYSTTDETPTVGEDNCVKIEVGTSYSTAGVSFNTTIANATLGATYYVRSYAINNAGTAYSDAKSVAVPSSYPTYTISYSTNGNPDGSSTVNQGNAIGTLPTPTSSYIPAGYEFVGWYNGDSYGSATAPTLVKATDVPEGPMNLKAMFAISPTGGEQCYEITVDDLTGNNAYGTTHSFTKGTTTFNAYGVYKNNGIQMNTGKGTYIKNTNTLPGVITRFSLTWSSSSNNTVTMYANAGSEASDSSANLGMQSAGTSQSINDLVGSNYNYFYLDGTTVSGACVMTSLKIYYIDYYYTTSATVPSGEYWHVNGDGELTENTIIPAGTYTLTSRLTVPEGKILTINGYLGTIPENLVVEDGGQLITKSSGVNATVKKNIEQATNWGTGTSYDADGWYFIASPVNGAPFPTGTVANQDIFQLDWANNKWLNLQYSGNSALLSAGFQRGTGYLYASKDGNTLSVAGEIKPLTEADTAKVILKTTGWNLIGNPLTCKVTVDCAFSELVKASAVTNKEANSVINPCQGIAVYGDAGTEVTFTKAATQDAVAPSNNNSLQMTLAKTITSRGDVSTKVVDNAVVSFKESKCMPKFNMIGGNTKLFIPQDDEEYSVVFSDRQGDVPLYFKANETGTYTISFAGDEMSLNGIYLIDILAEEEIDLSVNPSYTFIGSPADRMARFKIVFRNTGGDGTSDIFAYQNGNDIIVSGEGELQIFDVMGRMVSRQYVSGVEAINILTQGVYIMKLNDKTQKIVVR